MARFNMHTEDEEGKYVEGPFVMHDVDFQQLMSDFDLWSLGWEGSERMYPFVQEDGAVKEQLVAYKTLRYFEELEETPVS